MLIIQYYQWNIYIYIVTTLLIYNGCVYETMNMKYLVLIETWHFIRYCYFIFFHLSCLFVIHAPIQYFVFIFLFFFLFFNFDFRVVIYLKEKKKLFPISCYVFSLLCINISMYIRIFRNCGHQTAAEKLIAYDIIIYYLHLLNG